MEKKSLEEEKREQTSTVLDYVKTLKHIDELESALKEEKAKKKFLEESHPFLKDILGVMRDNLPSSIAAKQAKEQNKRVAAELNKALNEDAIMRDQWQKRQNRGNVP